MAYGKFFGQKGYIFGICIKFKMFLKSSWHTVFEAKKYVDIKGLSEILKFLKKKVFFAVIRRIEIKNLSAKCWRSLQNVY